MWLEVSREEFEAVMRHADKSKESRIDKPASWKVVHRDRQGKRLGHMEVKRGKINRYFIVAD